MRPIQENSGISWEGRGLFAIVAVPARLDLVPFELVPVMGRGLNGCCDSIG